MQSQRGWGVMEERSYASATLSEGMFREVPLLETHCCGECLHSVLLPQLHSRCNVMAKFLSIQKVMSLWGSTILLLRVEGCLHEVPLPQLCSKGNIMSKFLFRNSWESLHEVPQLRLGVNLMVKFRFHNCALKIMSWRSSVTAQKGMSSQSVVILLLKRMSSVSYASVTNFALEVMWCLSSASAAPGQKKMSSQSSAIPLLRRISSRSYASATLFRWECLHKVPLP